MIYFVQGETGGPIKIGYARNIDNRIKSLRTGCPYKLVLLGVMEGQRSDETKLHHKFAAARLQGEWFDDCAEIRAFIADTTEQRALNVVWREPPKPKSVKNPRKRYYSASWDDRVRQRGPRDWPRIVKASFLVALDLSFPDEQTRIEEIAQVASVTQRTAYNWWHGHCMPHAHQVVALSATRQPLNVWFKEWLLSDRPFGSDGLLVEMQTMKAA